MESVPQTLQNQVDRLPTTVGKRNRNRLSGRESWFLRAVSVALGIAAWGFLAAVPYSAVLPTPGPTFSEAARIIVSGDFISQLGITLFRVFGGFFLAFALSLPTGVLMARNRWIDGLFETPVLLGIMMPGLFVGIILFIMLGVNDVAAIVSIGVITAPILTINFYQGTKAMDYKLFQMAEVFRFSPLQLVRKVMLPQLAPTMFAGVRYGLGFAWKLVVVLEMIGLNRGVGYMVNYNFQLFNMKGVLAWTVSFMMVMIILEHVCFRLLEKRAFHWRTVVESR